MSVFAWLLWILFRGTVGGPVQHATWSEGAGLNPVQTPQHEATNPSFYHLPMFQHARWPLVSPELFRPFLQKSPLPTGLNALLFPQARQQHSVTGTGSRAVHVWCGFDDISVRVDRLHLSTWTDPSLFRLGSCPVSRVSPRFLYFHHRLSDCGGGPQVVGGQLVYSYALCYTPPRQGYVIRVVPLNFPIYCNYNRFHYSYQVGFRPQVQQTILMKSIRSRLSYSLTVCNAQGEPVPSGHWFFLGEPVYFVAQAAALLAGERLYVDSCYATSSSDPHSVHRADIITNYGCMPDSRRVGSSSRFLLGGGSVLKFSVDAFLFRELSQVLYLHCSMSVGLTTSNSSKSCSYDQAAGRWEELTAAASVCSCCDSMCGNIHQSIKNAVSSPGLLIRQRSDVKPRGMEMSQAEEARDWEDPEDKLEEEKDENHKEVQTFPQETEQEEASPKKTNETKAWRTSDVVTQQGNGEEEDVGETEVVMDETDSQLKEFSTEDIMSDQSTPEEFSSTEHASVIGLSSDNISTDASGTSATTTASSFAIDYDDTSNLGSAEDVSTAPLPTSELCADGDPKSCSTTINSIAGGAQSFTPDTVVGATNRSGSLWGTDASGTSATTTASSFAIDYDDTSNLGSAEDVSTAPLPTSELCADGDPKSCITTINSIAGGAQSFTPDTVVGATNRSGSLWGTDASGTSATTTASSFAIDYDDTSNLGSAEDVSTAPLPTSELCADGDPKSCITTINSTAGGAQSFTPDTVVGATNRSGSLWGTDASGTSATTTASSFAIDYDDTSNLGSAEDVSTAPLPTSELCADGDPKSCSTTINSIAGGAQSFTPDTVVGATNRSGSLWGTDASGTSATTTASSFAIDYDDTSNLGSAEDVSTAPLPTSELCADGDPKSCITTINSTAGGAQSFTPDTVVGATNRSGSLWGTDASGTSATTTASSFAIDYDDTSNLGSAEDVSTAPLPTSELCADGDPKSCSTTINSTAGGAQSFTPDTVVGATNRSGSLWESDIGDFETVGKHSATGDLGMDIPGLFNISRLEADQSDSLLWSEQSDWIQGQAEDEEYFSDATTRPHGVSYLSLEDMYEDNPSHSAL
ncbi:hypothetical protein OYC64_015187 [Pagothenia borchgrevinki]|uniref:ZP domain-containing protein n=1 Tax=Pagothenia borchgrevinki TaxID=8213 RepID=A0ABD2H3X2_PAGBO